MYLLLDMIYIFFGKMSGGTITLNQVQGLRVLDLPEDVKTTCLLAGRVLHFWLSLTSEVIPLRFKFTVVVIS